MAAKARGKRAYHPRVATSASNAHGHAQLQATVIEFRDIELVEL
jgi:hypothetical protein